MIFKTAWSIYLATRKKNDQLFNHYFMRPLAAGVVALVAPTPITPNQLTLLNLFVFLASAALLALLPTFQGGLIAVAVLEVSYCLDCADGMLARHRKTASKEGHLFDFFTDELKALVLAAMLGVRLYRTGGYGLDATLWPAGHVGFLFAAIAGTAVLASAISLTNFVRRPELSGKETTVEAHYETVEKKAPTSLVGRAGGLVTALLRFLNHYPSHIYVWALVGRLDLFFWTYVAINGLYLGLGWLKLIVRFGRS